jgi:hypothetical protein
MVDVQFDHIDENGATGTCNGRPFTLIAEREDEQGNIEEGIIEGGYFNYDEMMTIITQWEIKLDQIEQNKISTKVLRCIEYVEQALQQGERVKGVRLEDIEELKNAVEMVMMDHA